MDNSFNESFFSSLPADEIATSTPIKPKRINKNCNKEKFTCGACGKCYQLKHYYELHMREKHTINLDASVTNASNVHLDSSDLSFSKLQQPKNSNFKTPAPPKKKKPNNKTKAKPKSTLICPYCLKQFSSSSTTYYQTHIRTHIIQESATKYPSTATILENATSIAAKALTTVANSPCFGPNAENFRFLLGHILDLSSDPFGPWTVFCRKVCTDLLVALSDKKCLLPSALMYQLTKNLEKVLPSDVTSVSSVMDLLTSGTNFDRPLLAQFFLSFCIEYMTEIFKFISSTFHESFTPAPAKSIDIDKEDRQVIFYIGGSIMRGYLKMARRYPKSLTWKSVAEAIQEKILVEKPDGDVDAEWTADVDRGGLLYVCENFEQFLIGLTKIVFANENRDGSIKYETVIKNVSESDVCVLWDQAINESLPEMLSVNVMNDVLLCFSRTCARGFAKRRLNFFKKKGVVSMPMRHVVASRKNIN